MKPTPPAFGGSGKSGEVPQGRDGGIIKTNMEEGTNQALLKKALPTHTITIQLSL